MRYGRHGMETARIAAAFTLVGGVLLLLPNAFGGERASGADAPVQAAMQAALDCVQAEPYEFDRAKEILRALANAHGVTPLFEAYAEQKKLRYMALDILDDYSESTDDGKAIGRWLVAQLKRLPYSESEPYSLLTALRVGGHRSHVAVARKLVTAPDDSTRFAAVHTLAMLGGVAEAPRLVAALSDADDDVRMIAARYLGFLGGRTALRPLRAYFDGRRTGSKEWLTAAAALAALGDGAGIVHLEKALKGEDDASMDVRVAAALQLGSFADRFSIPALIDFLADPTIVKGDGSNPVWAAHWSLLKITETRSSFTVADCATRAQEVVDYWRRWWQRNGERKRSAWDCVARPRRRVRTGFRIRGPVFLWSDPEPVTMDVADVPEGAEVVWSVRYPDGRTVSIPEPTRTLEFERKDGLGAYRIAAVARRHGQQVARAEHGLYLCALQSIDTNGDRDDSGWALGSPVTCVIETAEGAPVDDAVCCWEVGSLPDRRGWHLPVYSFEVFTYGTVFYSARIVHRSHESSPAEVKEDTDSPGQACSLGPVSGFLSAGSLYRDSLFVVPSYRHVRACRIEAGPKGMTCTDDGAVTWQSRTTDTGLHPVVLEARLDDGSTVRHSFLLTVEPELRR